ncbi:NALCN channel auxiliary factor 1 [Gastrophryne carolinensis]
MTRGAWMCRCQCDASSSSQIYQGAPRHSDKPFADPERAQKWRLSLASLLFFTVLLSDHLWFCAEAKLTRTRDKEPASMAAAPHLPPPHSLSRVKKAIFLGNVTEHVWGAEPCPPSGGSCPAPEEPTATATATAAGFCGGRSGNRSLDFYLPFCNSYTLLDLFSGFSHPDTGMNCSGELLDNGDLVGCRSCVQAYLARDQQAQDQYREFEVLLQKYLQSDEYSVKSCSDDCKTVYKSWLCSHYFQVTQFECSSKIPCKQYCLEVQTRCPFILPDNDDVVYGGLSSFICTGLYENYPTNAEPECCDVRWEYSTDNQSKGTTKTHDSTMCHRTSLTASSASSLCNSRLKLCVLVLILLHTVLAVSAAQNSTDMGFENIRILGDRSPNEE